ncbi:MAG: endolytic transglycosylase MltG [Bacteroidetes bacterium]|nr:endolytic transglycosylase MltG [Bacteroidota bacterium]
MLKKFTIALVALFIAGLLWFCFIPFTKLDKKSSFLYLRTGQTSPDEVVETLTKGNFIQQPLLFKISANLMGLWPSIRPGKYEIQKQYSLLDIIRLLRNHRQSPVDLVITKLRTPAQLASLIGRKMECDSVRFIQYIQDSTLMKRFGIDGERLLFITHPNTYTYYWNADPETLIEKMYQYHHSFWNTVRVDKAKKLGLNPLEITTLASIVEEETLNEAEKPLIASVYINRLRKQMPLGADPTVKFATGNFALKRILFKHIEETAASPYNTYKNKGLPPGPICTPQESTIEAVLNAKETDYLFFCAAPGFTGTHNFAKNDKEHLKNAKSYQQWLNTEGIR